MRYVALLRGINVGGKNIIKMVDLKAAFEDMGYDEVSTYIQSGNVLFTTKTTPGKALETTIAKALGKRFGYDAKVLVRSKTQLDKTLKEAPSHWPDPAERMNLIFVKPPTTVRQVLDTLQPKEGIDTVHPGTGVVYLATDKAHLTKSGFPKFVGTKAYQDCTVRTHGTMSKIAAKL